MKKKRRFNLQPKLLLGLVIMAVVLVFVLLSVIMIIFGGFMYTYYSWITYDNAYMSSYVIDGDRIAQYYDNGKIGEKDDYYKEIADYLLNVKEEVRFQYLYVAVPEGDNLVYIWYTGTPDEENTHKTGDIVQLSDDEMEFMKKAADVKGAAIDENVLITENFATAYVPVYDSNNNIAAYVTASMSTESMNQNGDLFTVITLIVTLIVLIISSFIYYIYIKKILIRPLFSLHNAVTGLVSGHMEHLDEFTVDVKTKDEVGDLADGFEQMVKELNEYINNLSRVTAERERIGAELDVATHIQKSMLPCIFPAFPEQKEFDIYATMTPAKEVGGDFYDFFMVDERHLAIVMADVSGKGVPAALFMVIGKTLIKDHTQSGRSLGEVFTEVNDLLCESNSEGLFITAFEGVLDLVTGEFNYVNAGHEMPFICRAGESYEAQKIRAGFVLAGMEGIKYRAGSMTLSVGDKVFQYTDGVTEATNAQNELYGMERLGEVLNKNKDSSPAELLPKVKEDIDLFVGEAPQFDDITMLCLEYKSRMECNDEGTDN